METLIDNKPAQIADSKIRTGIFVVGTLCGLSYIGFFLLMSAFGWMHVTELRVFNYVVLVSATFLMIRKWIAESHHYIPFLRVVSAAFFTGLWSFIILAAFLYFYSLFNRELHDLFLLKTAGTFDTWPQFVVLFEGAGASIVTAFFMMQYFRRYEDGHPYPENK
jgi:hypothetical protein